MKLYFTYPDWKRKAVSFTYDDAPDADRRFVKLLNDNGLKSTFNLSAAFLSREKHIPPTEVISLYQGHEIASHGYNHLHLSQIPRDELLSELRDGRKYLEDLFQRPIRGFASPYGDHSEYAVSAMRDVGFTYARSCETTRTFYPAVDPMRWNSTCHHNDPRLVELTQTFIDANCWGGTLPFFNLFGHTYEFDNDNNWDRIENFVSAIAAHKESIWAATNIAVYDYVNACRNVKITMDGTLVENRSSIPLYGIYAPAHGAGEGAKKLILKPGEIINLDTVEPTEAPYPSIEITSTDIAIKTTQIKDGFTLTYPDWKRKALTFSFDDGTANDRPLAALLTKYGMPGTFNLNSDRMPETSERNEEGKPTQWMVAKDELKEVYAGHEVALHGALHETFSGTTWQVVLGDMYRDKANFEAILRRPIRGFAYPCGEYSKTQQGDTILRALDVVYGRLTKPAHDPFALPDDLLAWHPTSRHQYDILSLGKAFLEEAPRPEPRLISIWGHSFEFRTPEDWQHLEEFLKLMEKRDELWYATNIEIFEYIEAARKLIISDDGTKVSNPTSTPIYALDGDKKIII